MFHVDLCLEFVSGVGLGQKHEHQSNLCAEEAHRYGLFRIKDHQTQDKPPVLKSNPAKNDSESIAIHFDRMLP